MHIYVHIYIHIYICRYIYTNVRACTIYLYVHLDSSTGLCTNEQCVQQQQSPASSSTAVAAATEQQTMGMDCLLSTDHLNQSATRNRYVRISEEGPPFTNGWWMSCCPFHLHQHGTSEPRHHGTSRRAWAHPSVDVLSLVNNNSATTGFGGWWCDMNPPTAARADEMSWVGLQNKNTVVVDAAHTKRHFKKIGDECDSTGDGGSAFVFGRSVTKHGNCILHCVI